MKKFIVLIGLLGSTTVWGASVTQQTGWLHTPNSNYGDAVAVNLRDEIEVYPNLGLAIDGGYHGKSYHTFYGDVSGYSLLGDLIYHIPLKSKIRPYILGGLGWSWWHFDRNKDLKAQWIQVKLGNSFANKIGVGFDYPLDKNWSLNCEWYYFQSHVPKRSYYEADGSFANVVGGDTVGQEETDVVVGVSYNW